MSDFPKCAPVIKAAKLRWSATNNRACARARARTHAWRTIYCLPEPALNQSNNHSLAAGSIAVMGQQPLAVITPLLWITSGAAAPAGCAGEGEAGGGMGWGGMGGSVLGGGGQPRPFSSADSRCFLRCCKFNLTVFYP